MLYIFDAMMSTLYHRINIYSMVTSNHVHSSKAVELAEVLAMMIRIVDDRVSKYY